jgi:uncharacterized protein YndB with AHSA1/START domain
MPERNSDRELVFTRLYDAPASLVYEAFTRPEHLQNWWGPNGFHTTIQEMDVRPGGVWRLTLRGPDGRDYRNRLVFVEVDPPRRLVYRHEPEPGSEPASHQVTVTFETEGTQTRLTMVMLFPSAANRNYIVKTYGAEEGGKQTFQRLAQYLSEISPREQKDLVVERTIAAPRERVFQAFTDPKLLAQWWTAQGFANSVREADARPGGKILIQGPDGIPHPMYGAYQEVRPPERLVFLTGLTEPDGSIAIESRHTVTLTGGSDGNTHLRFESRVITANATAMRRVEIDAGWPKSLDRLATFTSEEQTT